MAELEERQVNVNGLHPLLALQGEVSQPGETEGRQTATSAGFQDLTQGFGVPGCNFGPTPPITPNKPQTISSTRDAGDPMRR